MIGTQIGNYQVVEKIGEGGMGVVYRGIDVTLDRPVAIKVLSQELVGTPALVERFRAEARAQANLNHTNIATLYSFMQVNGVCVMVMELLDGETFDQIIRRRGVIPAEEAVPLFRQALLGIGFAHRMGIVHRDIKPSNIMLTKNGIVKVMDFGIAKVLGGQRMTRTGTRMGTVAYMSPEQIRNMPVDIRSDIYSLGATLYEMFTAHLPFESESDFQVMSDHVNTPPTPPTRYYPYIAPGFEQCVLKALAKDPNQRFQTVEEFGAGLEHPLGLPGYVPPAPVQGQWVQPGQPAIQPGGWAPPGTPPPGQAGWTPTGAAPGGQWTPPATPPPVGRWTPPPGTPPAGTYGGSPAQGQPSMSGATWIGDGPAGSGPPYTPGMAGVTQAPIPPNHGSAAPTTAAPAGPSKNMIFVVLGVAALMLIIVAIGIARWRNSEETGGGGTSSSTYVPAGGGGGGLASSGTTSGAPSNGSGSSAPVQPPSQPAAGGGGLAGGGESGGGNGAGGLVPQSPSSTAPSGGAGSNHAPPASSPHKAAPPPSMAPSTPPPSVEPAPTPSATPPPATTTPAPAPAPAATVPTAPAGSHRYFVQHRHVSIDFRSKSVTTQSYCEGYLTVESDGTGSYYCTQTFDGRCDRVTFGKGSIHEVKVNGTQLHLSSSYGNYDFYGTGASAASDMAAAFQILSLTIKH
jgi:hypothetical protein